MAFAFNPDDRPARLFRYMEPGAMPGDNLLTLYYEEQNLLIINREEFEKLTDFEQKQVLRTQQPCLTIRPRNDKPSKLAA